MEKNGKIIDQINMIVIKSSYCIIKYEKLIKFLKFVK